MSFDYLRETYAEGHSLRGFDEHQCIFLHIPKTGGMSVAECLFGYQVGHHRMSELAEVFPEFYFRFTFVRDPLDRLVSAYEYYRQGGAKESDAQWAKENLGESFEDFVLNRLESVLDVPHFLPQTYWLDRPVDFIGDFNYLKYGVEYIQAVLDFPKKKLPFLNKSNRGELSNYYTPESEALVREIYWEDFNLPLQRVSRV